MWVTPAYVKTRVINPFVPVLSKYQWPAQCHFFQWLNNEKNNRTAK